MKEEFHYMRTLKKTLALVLVVAMVLSFGIIGASADFTDVKADNDYKEAIDVLVGIGVINGMDNGKFEPDGSLTRAQAAKIIAYLMLGATNAENMSNAAAQKFDDVPTSHWAAGYIEYAANLGIINGVGDNKFDPEASLSTAAFSKMLLCALGYQAGAENLIGETWVINVATLAVSAGISDSDIPVSASRTITRAEACQLAFLTLQARTVKYTGGTSMEVNGITITSGAVRDYVANTEAKDYRGTSSADKDLFMQFCEQYFPKLKKTVSGEGDFGRPNAYSWEYKSKEIATGASTPDLTYTTAVKSSTLYTDLSKNNYTAGDVDIVIDGETDETVNSVDEFAVKKGLSTTIGGNGALTEVYKTSDTEITIVVINSYIDIVDSVNEDDDERTISFRDAAGTFETEDFEEDDVVVLTIDDDTVRSVALAETVSGTLNSFSARNVKIEGSTYNYNVAVDDTEKAAGKGISAGTEVTIYLDSYGYVLKIETYDEAAASSNYAYVIAADKVGEFGSTGTNKAQLLYTDGTTEIVETDKNYHDYVGMIVKFATKSNGKTTLNDVSAEIAKVSVDINRGVSMFTAGTDYYANNNTIFLVAREKNGEDQYDAYVGYKNVPDVSGTLNATVYCKSTSSKLATVVFVDATGGTVIGGNDVKTVVFAAFKSGVEYYDEDLGTYYEYNAVVDGKITTVRTDEALTENTIFTTVTYDDNDVIIVSSSDISSLAKKGSGIGTIATTGLISLDTANTNKEYVYDDATEIYSVDKDGNIKSRSMSNVDGDPNDGLNFVVDKDNAYLLTYLFVQDVVDPQP